MRKGTYLLLAVVAAVIGITAFVFGQSIDDPMPKKAAALNEPGRFQLFVSSQGVYRLDTATGKTWFSIHDKMVVNGKGGWNLLIEQR
jgi:hypothetical protein